jgi:pSer/pThr/pTyr-binding forkhead associated (FHA) protein
MDLFLQACGAREPLTLIVEDPDRHKEQRYVLPKPFALIGRDALMDVPLDDPHISRRHAYLQLVANQAYCVDLGSRIGTHQETRPNGKQDEGSTLAIRIGPYRLRRWESLPGPAPFAVGTIPDVTLEFDNEAGREAKWRITQPLELVGSSPDCQLRLIDASVARIHCSLVRTPLGVWVVDLFGRGGVHVNGKKVRCGLLADADQLQVGSVIMQVRCGVTAPTRARPTQLATGLEAEADTAMEGPGAAEARSALPAVLRPTQPSLPMVDRSGQGAELMEAVLMPVLNQFSLMQQQMFDQFNQTLSLMVQMFGRMHKDQMGFLREELDRINELNKELHAAQAELARQKVAAAQAGAAAPAGESAANGSRSRATVPPPAPAAAPAPRRPGPSAAPAASPAAKPAAAAAGAAPLGAPQPGQAPPDADIHTWLHQRIANLQQERQSRWQKILGFLAGKSG